MKIKALLLSMIILMGIMVFLVPAPSVFADAKPSIWVSPKYSNFTSPCNVSNTFTIEIKLWNKEDLTGVGIYAFDFNLTWRNSTNCLPGGSIKQSMISLVGIDVIPPWATGKYFIVKNETGNDGVDRDWYHLALTAVDSAPPLEDVQIVLVKLTFHIDNEPCYPDTWYTEFVFESSELVGDCGVDLTHDTHNGWYFIKSLKPGMKVKPEIITEHAVCNYHTVEIWLYNVAKLYGFGFTLTFNGTLLEATIQCVHITDLLPPPYEVQVIQVGDDYVSVQVIRPSEKPPISCVEGPVVTICLHSIFKDIGKKLPTAENVTLGLENAWIMSKCPLARVYKPYDIEMTGDGTVTATSDGAQLYVKDGVTDWAGIDIEVDIPLSGITQLQFDEIITWWSTEGWTCNVILGIDADGDGDFEADLPAWHQGATMHTLAVLKGDTFIQVDGATNDPWPPAWTTTNALTLGQWWTPDVTGTTFAGFYGTFAGMLGFIPGDSLIPNTDVRVKLIKILIGGSGNWMDETAYVKNLVFNGELYDLYHWLNVYDGEYRWKPKKEDLDLSCHVDFDDLTALAKVYGSNPISCWTGLAAPIDQAVDIYDFVVVAKKVCKD